MDTEISGGSRETVVKALTAMPTASPSTMEEIAVTPLGKQLNAARRTDESVGAVKDILVS
ncbi:hypothetical protein ACH4D3_32695 [Streptomyces sp. NPDC018026]|uniref:hypothetical protein n=1 Tax=Streptomyces sp. NPDC018026 TaxID=3365031 RepID=UPI0037B80EFA